jgi:endonuclease-8
VPEGDSLHRIARQLAPLVGKTIERATTRGLTRELAGHAIISVAAHGKHLVIELDDGTQIRTHLGMTGRVRRYPRSDGEAVVARMSPGRASLVLAVTDMLCLWVTTPTVEISPRRGPRHGQAISTLGPDVMSGDFDGRQAASRAALHGSRTISDVLLDQRVVAGIGNIWRCETLHACEVDPRATVDALPEDVLAAIYATAHALMRASLERGRHAYRVYQRGGEACARCGQTIEVYRMGDPLRWTWSCPGCQRASW